jgi:hypothetical protein
MKEGVVMAHLLARLGDEIMRYFSVLGRNTGRNGAIGPAIPVSAIAESRFGENSARKSPFSKSGYRFCVRMRPTIERALSICEPDSAAQPQFSFKRQ